MFRPAVTPLNRRMEPVTHDTFNDEPRVRVVKPSPRSRGFIEMVDDRKRFIEPAS